MNIAIISDIHDNLANLDKFLKYAKENYTDQVICLGDVTNDSTVEHLAKGFNGKINLVLGNADFFDKEYIKIFSNLTYFGELAELNIAGKKISFAHKPDQVKFLIDGQKYDYLFFGHTHKPWEEQSGKTKLLNPGTVAGTSSKATFAVWNTDMDIFQLILIDELP